MFQDTKVSKMGEEDNFGINYVGHSLPVKSVGSSSGVIQDASFTKDEMIKLLSLLHKNAFASINVVMSPPPSSRESSGTGGIVATISYMNLISNIAL